MNFTTYKLYNVQCLAYTACYLKNSNDRCMTSLHRPINYSEMLYETTAGFLFAHLLLRDTCDLWLHISSLHTHNCSLVLGSLHSSQQIFMQKGDCSQRIFRLIPKVGLKINSRLGDQSAQFPFFLVA